VLKQTLRTWRKAHGAALLLTLMGSMVIAGTAQASTATPALPAGLTFDGNFSTLNPWQQGGGGAQCANYGTPSNSPRLRGTYTQAPGVAGMGSSGEFTLPADSNTSTYPLEACDLLTGSQPMALGADGYYGLMVYVPQGWTIPSSFFTGVEIEEYHFQNIYGAPISFQLHANHVTMALQMGACNSHTTATPGCVYHSNADNPNGNPGTLPAEYVIPPGALVQGQWNEMLLHVHWADDSSGQIQTWYKTTNESAWTQSSNVTGVPTVQWDNTTTCCDSSYVDETEAYSGSLSAPMSLWLGDDLAGTSFNAVSNSMGSAPPPPPTNPPAKPHKKAGPLARKTSVPHHHKVKHHKVKHHKVKHHKVKHHKHSARRTKRDLGKRPSRPQARIA
jgi:hypothetical protein